jgi:hypothetical protein
MAARTGLINLSEDIRRRWLLLSRKQIRPRGEQNHHTQEWCHSRSLLAYA